MIIVISGGLWGCLAVGRGGGEKRWMVIFLECKRA
jgi:hypothetical protein